MINHETDKWMEAVREAATIAAWSKDNDEKILRLERELQKGNDLIEQKEVTLSHKQKEINELKVIIQNN